MLKDYPAFSSLCSIRRLEKHPGEETGLEAYRDSSSSSAF